MTESVAYGNKSGRKIGTHTPSWKLFESLFFKSPGEYPLRLTGLTKGQAINMAMGLNRCHVQYMQERGAPSDALTLSAKAKDEGESWTLEISESFKRQGKAPPSKKQSTWIGDILSRVQEEIKPTREAESSPAEEPADPITQAIRNTYGDIL